MLPRSQCSSICKDLCLPSGATAIKVSNPSKRSGKSVSRSAITSPRSPRVLATRATTTRSSLTSFNNIEHKPAMLLHPGSINQRAQRAHRAALLADHFAHVRLGHPDFDARHSISFDLTHVHSVSVIDQGFDDHFDSFAHYWILIVFNIFMFIRSFRVI